MKKLLPLILIALISAMPAIAADTVSERQTCPEIQAEIDLLAAESDLDDVDAERLKNLRSQYRRTCQKSAAGRRTNARAISAIAKSKTSSQVVAESAAAAAETGDAVDSFLAKKQENCKSLQAAIEKLKSADKPDNDEIEKMQAQYDADCADKSESSEPDVDPEAAAIAEAEKIAALIEQGLCADGTKPNKYGCCTGEKFKDMGNLEFACCKEDTNECFPPMK